MTRPRSPRSPGRKPASDPVDDKARMLRAMRAAVRDALRLHKAAGNPIAVWRRGRVEWIPAERIPVSMNGSGRRSPRRHGDQ